MSEPEETYICKRCKELVWINDGCEAGDYCDECAQTLVVELTARAKAAEDRENNTERSAVAAVASAYAASETRAEKSTARAETAERQAAAMREALGSVYRYRTGWSSGPKFCAVCGFGEIVGHVSWCPIAQSLATDAGRDYVPVADLRRVIEAYRAIDGATCPNDGNGNHLCNCRVCTTRKTIAEICGKYPEGRV